MSCPSTYRKANKGAVLCHALLFIARRTRGWFLQMSVPGMLSFHLSQGANGWFPHMCVAGFALVMSSYLSRGEKNGGLNTCLYPALPVACLPTYCNVNSSLCPSQDEREFDTCAYQAFSLSAVMSSYLSQGAKGWY